MKKGKNFEGLSLYFGGNVSRPFNNQFLITFVCPRPLKPSRKDAVSELQAVGCGQVLRIRLEATN